MCELLETKIWLCIIIIIIIIIIIVSYHRIPVSYILRYCRIPCLCSCQYQYIISRVCVCVHASYVWPLYHAWNFILWNAPSLPIVLIQNLAQPQHDLILLIHIYLFLLSSLSIDLSLSHRLHAGQVQTPSLHWSSGHQEVSCSRLDHPSCLSGFQIYPSWDLLLLWSRNSGQAIKVCDFVRYSSVLIWLSSFCFIYNVSTLLIRF